MLIYALLHLSGYDLPIEELKRFRQMHSKTRAILNTVTRPASKPPADRSARHHQAVGMAMAEKLLAASSTSPARDRQPPHLCVHGRRLHDGRHFP